MQTKAVLFVACLLCLIVWSSQLPSQLPSRVVGTAHCCLRSAVVRGDSGDVGYSLRKSQHSPLRIRGGAGDGEASEEETKKVSLLDELKTNLSWNPADHPSGVHWALCVILNLYVAFGAPLASYIPVLKDLALSRKPKKETKVTKADLERIQREALRKEQDEEFEKSLLEDKVKAKAEKKQQELEEAAEKAAQEEADAKSSVLDGYRARVEEAKSKLTPEPDAGPGVVVLRLRCPDGLQLTRRFRTDGEVAGIYHYLDVERCSKAETATDPDEAKMALANEEYSLVSTRPKLCLDDKTATIASAGVTTSCALMVKPVAREG